MEASIQSFEGVDEHLIWSDEADLEADGDDAENRAIDEAEVQETETETETETESETEEDEEDFDQAHKQEFVLKVSKDVGRDEEEKGEKKEKEKEEKKEDEKETHEDDNVFGEDDNEKEEEEEEKKEEEEEEEDVQEGEGQGNVVVEGEGGKEGKGEGEDLRCEEKKNVEQLYDMSSLSSSRNSCDAGNALAGPINRWTSSESPARVTEVNADQEPAQIFCEQEINEGLLPCESRKQVSFLYARFRYKQFRYQCD